MPTEYIGPVAIPDLVITGTFPITVQFGSVDETTTQVAVHRFGAGEAQREQRFYLGNGERRFRVQLGRMSNAKYLNLVSFWTLHRGPTDAFTVHVEDQDGGWDWTMRFAGGLSLDQSADGSWDGAVDLIEVPTLYPTLAVSSTVNRFPASGLLSTLTGQAQQIIPLLKITPAGQSAIYLSDRRCNIGTIDYQPRLLSWSGIEQSIDGSADQAEFTLGNADRVFTSLANQWDLWKADVEFSLFHVGSTTKIDLWKGAVLDWVFDGSPEFRLTAADGFSELRQAYPNRKISRQDGFTVPDQPVSVGGKKGISKITATSVVNDTAYGKPLKDIYCNAAGGAGVPFPVPVDVIAGRDESEFYAALGVIGRGPIGGFQGSVDNRYIHTLDGQPWHGYSANNYGLRRSYGGNAGTGSEALTDNSPDQGSNYFALDSTSTTWPQTATGPTGAAFIQIRRTDEKGIQAIRPSEHPMQAWLTSGLGCYTWSGSGPYTRTWTPGCTNPVWIVINIAIRAKGLQAASQSAQEALFAVPEAIAAAAVCDATVTKIIGTGSETQFRFVGMLAEEKPLRDWIQEILQCCLGYWSNAFGKLKIGLRINSSTVSAFTAGNVVYNSLSLASRRPQFNDLTVGFADEDYAYQQNTVNIYDATHQGLFGQLKANVNVAGLGNKSQAARVLTVRFREELGGINAAEWAAARKISFQTTILALDVDPGMVCSMTHPDMPGGAGEFRVRSWRLNRDYSIDISGETTTDSMYDLTVGPKPDDIQPDDIPPKEIPPVVVNGTIGDNLIRNPGFEGDLVGWFGFDTGFEIEVDSLSHTADTGQRCLRVVPAGAQEIHQPSAYQDGERDVLPCSFGDTFRFRGKYRFEAGSTVSVAQARVAFYDPSGAYSDYSGTYDLDPAATTWSDFEISVAVPSGSSYVLFFPFFGEILTGKLFIDTLAAYRNPADDSMLIQISYA